MKKIFIIMALMVTTLCYAGTRERADDWTSPAMGKESQASGQAPILERIWEHKNAKAEKNAHKDCGSNDCCYAPGSGCKNKPTDAQSEVK